MSPAVSHAACGGQSAGVCSVTGPCQSSPLPAGGLHTAAERCSPLHAQGAELSQQQQGLRSSPRGTGSERGATSAGPRHAALGRGWYWHQMECRRGTGCAAPLGEEEGLGQLPGGRLPGQAL